MLRVQADLANARGDLRRVVDDDFFSFRFAQITEFVEHFLGRFEIQRRLVVRVLESVRCLNGSLRNFPSFGSRKARRPSRRRNAQLFAEPDDLAVEIAQLFFVFRHALAQHERVVADGLNFKIVVEPRDPF